MFTPGKIRQLKAPETPEMTVEIFRDILLDFWDVYQQRARERGPISFFTSAIANYFAFENFESDRVFPMVNDAVREIHGDYEPQFKMQGGFLYDRANLPEELWERVMYDFIPRWLQEETAPDVFSAARYLVLMLFLMLESAPLSPMHIGNMYARAMVAANNRLLRTYNNPDTPKEFTTAFRSVIYSSNHQVGLMGAKRASSTDQESSAKFSKTQDDQTGVTLKVPGIQAQDQGSQQIPPITQGKGQNFGN